jgi:hypothetical protein
METNGMETLIMKWSSVEQWMKWNGMSNGNGTEPAMELVAMERTS